MSGTVHENDWFFYHVALSLMTAKECKSWMERTLSSCGLNYMQKWLVPQNGLKEGTVYEGRPVGNSPEFM